MADAVSGDTIFLRDSVTENVTITPGVNIAAWYGGSLNTPSITGTLTMTGAGTSTISGITLITNSAAIIAVTGSAASILNLNNCYLNCTNNTGITYSSSSSSSRLNLYNCNGDLGTTGIGLFANSSAGTMNINGGNFTNSGGSSTASTVSAGAARFFHVDLFIPITTSGTASIQLSSTNFDTNAQNATCLTIGGSGNGGIANCNLSSGTASAISIGSTCTVNSSTIFSSNTNAITGAGTIYYNGISFAQGSSTVINTTTQTASGTLQGSKNTAPTAGMLGEQIRSFVVVGSAITLTNSIQANVTSISLTAGIWDVSAIIVISNGSITGTQYGGSISTTSATGGTEGDNAVYVPGPSPTAVSDLCLSIPSYRLTLTSTTTVYLVAFAAFTVGTAKASGRISGTRVG